MSRPAVKPGGPDEPERRPYHSPARERRASKTRARIVAAARSLFLSRGYFPTTMRAIAKEAGVAEKTVYLVFDTKAALLDAVIDAAISDASESAPRAGDDRRDPAGETNSALRDFCHFAAQVMDRTARVLAIAEAAATVDPELASLREPGHAAMRTRFEAIAARLDSAGALAPGTTTQDAAATIYAIANEAAYLRLIDGYGWTNQQYAEWLERTLATTLLQAPSGSSSRSAIS